MEDNSLSIEGSAQDIVFQAGEKIGWAPERIDKYLSDPGLRLNKAIPACVYKGNQDEEMEGSGDISAWAHLFNLDSAFANPDICPPQMKQLVEDHIDQYREKVPKTNLKSEPEPNTGSQEGNTSYQRKPVTPQVDQTSNNSRKPELETVETVVLAPHSPHSRNTNFALLGREIARHTGVEKGGERKAESQKAGYRIAINVATNTMRSYNLERSSDRPILVDRNGQIDHNNAQVSSQDVECFQNVVDAIHRTQLVNQKAQQIEL